MTRPTDKLEWRHHERGQAGDAIAGVLFFATGVLFFAIAGGVFYCQRQEPKPVRQDATIVQVGQCDDALIGAGDCAVILSNGSPAIVDAPAIAGMRVWKYGGGDYWQVNR